MPIEIAPHRLATPTSSVKRTDERRRQTLSTNTLYRAPSRSELNYIPSMESLRTLISSAVEALRSGITWDRGTIINLLV